MLGPQDLDGVPEAHPLRLHHPVDRRSPSLAGPEAVPEVLARRDDEGGLPVVVEGAEADQVGPVPLQLHPPRLGQALERDLVTDPPEQVVGDAGHGSAPFVENPVSGRGRQEEHFSLDAY